jgi:hypothetical protein
MEGETKKLADEFDPNMDLDGGSGTEDTADLPGFVSVSDRQKNDIVECADYYRFEMIADNFSEKVEQLEKFKKLIEDAPGKISGNDAIEALRILRHIFAGKDKKDSSGQHANKSSIAKGLYERIGKTISDLEILINGK